MLQRRFKLTIATNAIVNEPSVVTIPANALVTVVAGDPNGEGFIKVRYGDKILSMSAVDLRSNGERVREHSS